MKSKLLLSTLLIFFVIAASCKKKADSTPTKTTGHIKIKLSQFPASFHNLDCNYYLNSSYTVTVDVMTSNSAIGSNVLKSASGQNGDVFDLGELNPGNYWVIAHSNNYTGQLASGLCHCNQCPLNGQMPQSNQQIQVVENQDQTIDLENSFNWYY